MNNTFDWTRFKKLVAMDWRNLWPKFGTTMLNLALIPAGIWVFTAAINLIPDVDISIIPVARLVSKTTLLAICAILAPSVIYKTCNQPKDGIYYAMLPASHLEKFISQLLFCVFVAPLLMFAGSVVVDIILTALPFGPYQDWIWNSFRFINDAQSDIMLMSEEDIDVYNFFQASMSTIVISLVVSYFFYSAVFLFTNTVFKTHKVIKTILAIIIVSFVISLLSNVILFAVYANTDTESISTEDFVSAYKTLVVTLNVVYALIAAGFFAGTFLRLKRMKY